jgi:hypothetical protein
MNYAIENENLNTIIIRFVENHTAIYSRSPRFELFIR